MLCLRRRSSIQPAGAWQSNHRQSCAGAPPQQRAGRRGRAARRCAGGAAHGTPAAARPLSQPRCLVASVRAAAGGETGETLVSAVWVLRVRCVAGVRFAGGWERAAGRKRRRGERRARDADAGQQVPQLRGAGRGCVRSVYMRVCVRAACPLPPSALPERGGRSAAARPLKTARPSRSCLARQEGGCRDPRYSAAGAGERSVGRRRPCGAGRAGLRQPAGGGGGGAVGRAVGCLDGRFLRLPCAPGSLAAQGRALPSPASHCSKFARRWAAELLAIQRLGSWGLWGGG